MLWSVGTVASVCVVEFPTFLQASFTGTVRFVLVLQSETLTHVRMGRRRRKHDEGLHARGGK